MRRALLCMSTQIDFAVHYGKCQLMGGSRFFVVVVVFSLIYVFVCLFIYLFTFCSEVEILCVSCRYGPSSEYWVSFNNPISRHSLGLTGTLEPPKGG